MAHLPHRPATADTEPTPPTDGGEGDGGARHKASQRLPLISLGRSVAPALIAVFVGGGFLALSLHGAVSAPPHVGPQIPVTAMDRDLGAANNSPNLVADPNDDQFVVLANRLDAPDFSCALQLSFDGGKGWLPANPVPTLPEGAEKCYAPEVAFDRRGVIYYLFAGLKGGGNQPVGVFLTMSADRGRTFSRPHKVLEPNNFSARLVIDQRMGQQGRIHLVWLHATSDPPSGGLGPPPNPILAAYSDDGGETFSTPVQVNDPARQRVVAPAVTLGPGHTVTVAYYDVQDDLRDYQGLEGPVWEGTWSLVVSSSLDGGRRFERNTIVDTEVTPPERVMVIFTMAPASLVSEGNRQCLGWGDGRNGDSDVFVRCSTNGGRTWAGARRVNDDKVGNGRSQYLPRLSFGPRGRLDVVFYDRRDDSQNLNNDVSYSFSTDGGKIFARNVRLNTEGSSFSLIGQQYAIPSAAGMYDFGVRMAVLSQGDHVLAAWADTHNSRPQTAEQDVFATEITLGHREWPDWGRRVAVVFLLAGGLLAARALRKRRLGRRHQTGLAVAP